MARSVMETILKRVQHPPTKATPEAETDVLSKFQHGLAQSKAGLLIPHGEVKKQFSGQTSGWLAFAMIALLCAQGVQSQAANLSIIAGAWHGFVRQNDGQSYDIKVIIFTRPSSSGLGALVHYPSIPCSGRWQLQNISNGTFEFNEEITSGKTLCIVFGKVRLKRIQDKLEFTYESEENQITANAVLIRE
jgi:hypothetical protein